MYIALEPLYNEVFAYAKNYFLISVTEKIWGNIKKKKHFDIS